MCVHVGVCGVIPWHQKCVCVWSCGPVQPPLPRKSEFFFHLPLFFVARCPDSSQTVGFFSCPQENVSLADILSLRDSCLSEQDVWAVCAECLQALQSIRPSHLFHTLCITPDTLAFNAHGNVCFMEQLSGESLVNLQEKFTNAIARACWTSSGSSCWRCIQPAGPAFYVVNGGDATLTQECFHPWNLMVLRWPSVHSEDGIGESNWPGFHRRPASLKVLHLSALLNMAGLHRFLKISPK